MKKHLEIHDWPDYKDASPTNHNVYIHDFAMLASHDVPCMVCWNNPALYERNMTPGQYEESWQPCEECQENGWRLQRRLPSKILTFFKSLLVDFSSVYK